MRMNADERTSSPLASPSIFTQEFVNGIVQKAIDLGFVGDRLIHSSDGTEYVTWTKLGEEILHMMVSGNDRISLTEIAQKLRVDYASVVEKASELVTDEENHLQLILGDLVSRSYFDRVTAEITKILETKGTTSTQELCQVFSLPVHVVQKFLDRFQEFTSPHDPTILFTASYVQKQRDLLQNIFSKFTVPTPITSVLSQTGIGEANALAILEELMKSNAISGSLKSRIYYPNVYINSLVSKYDSQMSLLGFINIDEAEHLDVRRYIDSINLDNVLCSKPFLDGVIACVDEEIKETMVVDVCTHIPQSFPSHAAQPLAKHISQRIATAKVHLHDTYLYTEPYKQRMLDKGVEWVKACAIRDSQEAKKHRALDKSFTTVDVTKFLVTECAVTQQLATHFAQEWKRDLLVLYEQTVDRIAKSGVISPDSVTVSSETKDAWKTQLQKRLEEFWLRIALYHTGVKYLFKDAKTLKSAEEYVCSTIGVELRDTVLMLAYVACCEDLSPYLISNGQIKMSNLSKGERLQVISELEDSVVSRDVLKLLSADVVTLQALMSSLESLSTTLSLTSPTVTQDTTREQIRTILISLHQQLQTTQDSALILHISVMSFVMIQHECVLHLSGRFVPALLKVLRDEEDQENEQTKGFVTVLKNAAKEVMRAHKGEIKEEDIKVVVEDVRATSMKKIKSYLG